MTPKKEGDGNPSSESSFYLSPRQQRLKELRAKQDKYYASPAAQKIRDEDQADMFSRAAHVCQDC